MAVPSHLVGGPTDGVRTPGIGGGGGDPLKRGWELLIGRVGKGGGGCRTPVRLAALPCCPGSMRIHVSARGFIPCPKVVSGTCVGCGDSGRGVGRRLWGLLIILRPIPRGRHDVPSRFPRFRHHLGSDGGRGAGGGGGGAGGGTPGGWCVLSQARRIAARFSSLSLWADFFHA